MRVNRILLGALCLLMTGALYAQSAALKAAPTSSPNHIGALSFAYDAPHDQMIANGVSLNVSPRNSGITPTTGMVVVTVNIDAVSHFRKDTRFHCSLIVIGGILDLKNGVVDGAIETANATADGSVCKLSIPYSWILPPDPNGSTGLILAFGVSAVDGDDESRRVKRSTLQLGGVESLPANGTTTSFAFDVVL